ncbi:hypothetical protein HK100_010996 [Physocladia obscura]|uniref:Uncharacterized protein n=1 Tax=Physocladia obscura TaxID=109957 RepID=A0AAD5T1W0_9FUNG|nr:hypothetical protein HK100_010996 [Physocladia obscura]
MSGALTRISQLEAQLSQTSEVGEWGGDNGRKVWRTELSPVSLLRRTAALHPNRCAFIVAGNNNATCDYAEFARRVKQLAIALERKAGVIKGESVAVLMPNSNVILEAHFAVPLAGAVLVCINTRLTQREVEYILKKSKSRVLLVDASLMHLTVNWKSCGVRVIIPCEDAYGLPTAHLDRYEQFLGDCSKLAVKSDWSDFPPLKSEDDSIAINFTSGTTGNPKGVVTHYRGAYLNALCLAVEMQLTCETNYLWTLPMFHASGWCFPWAVSAVGGTHTLLRKIDYPTIWNLFINNRITHYCAAPTVQLAIVNYESAVAFTDRKITTMVAAAPPSPTLLEALLKLGIHPIHVYGLTETYGPCTVCTWQPEWHSLPLHELAEKLSRQGHTFLAGDETIIVDFETGQPVPSDGITLGEVCFSGNLVMKGYLDDESATREAFRGGVFHTGDVAVKHPDGYIELKDRSKDIIISGGENISTIEIENAVMTHDRVLECCVVSTPDEAWGERPVVYLTLKRQNVNAAGDEAFVVELLAFLKGLLAGFKMPVRVNVVAELPKTSTGKIQKFILREAEWKNFGGSNGGRKGKLIN